MIIHPGLPKTASTSIQSILSNDPRVSLMTREDLYQVVVPAATNPARVGNAVEMLRKFEASAIDNGVLPVISEERLWGYPHASCFDRYLIGRILAEAFPHATVVLSVRNQVSWCMSLYREYLLSGGYRTLKDYLFGYGGTLMVPHFDWECLLHHESFSYYNTMFGGGCRLIFHEEIGTDNYEKSWESALGFRPEVHTVHANKGLHSENFYSKRKENFFNEMNLLEPANPFPETTLTGCTVELTEIAFQREVASLLYSRVGSVIADSNCKLGEAVFRDLSDLGYLTNINNLD